MRRCNVVIVCLLLYMAAAAQDAVSLQSGLGNGNRFILPLQSTYQFPTFMMGIVYFRGGEATQLMLNYNVARDEMHCIQPSGDTVIVDEPTAIASIKINNNRFYFDKDRWVQEIGTRGGVTLAYKQLIKIQVLAALPYATKPTLPAQQTGNSTYFTGDGQKVALEEGMVGVLRTTTYYFFGDKYGNFLPANKARLLRLFPQHEFALRAFIKSHHTNFNTVEGLLEVMEFCETLRKSAA
ncbi:MAG TPA: hypothetical protein VL307_20730 [Chitinophagaceae bacterium]|nr:hypothetical protein [Chitinophagaceae bacterium]